MYFQSGVLPVEERGASSIEGTQYMVSQLPALFKKHNISSIFDAGANDCAWQKDTLAKLVRYTAGDHNPLMVDLAKAAGINAVVHDVRKDLFPAVDALFIRDVAIHLNNANKKLMIQNWQDSSVPWILMTHINNIPENKDFEHIESEFPFAEINWKLPPWNFPEPTDFVVDLWPDSYRYMALWHRSQICL